MKQVKEYLEFGCLARPMREQLPADMRHRAKDLQSIHDAITILHVRGYLTDSETRRAEIRLIRRIETEVRGGKRA